MAGQAIGSKNQSQYDYGQAGQAERVLHQAAPQFNAGTEDVPIQARAPGVTFATYASMRRAAREVAFSISRDYRVCILSRIRELWARGRSQREAVVGGIASSAGVVTSAALIIVAVFSIFVTMPLIELKILSAGMAAAVLIVATVVRDLLLPTALSLLGDHAWRS